MGTVLLTHDAQGRPAIVEFDGVKYGYVHNLQGDIVAIIDGSGNQVVEYTYDAWGKPLTRTGTLASTLGYWSPFRYRGYVYDEETGLYYLRSRYYNPTLSRMLSSDAVGAIFGQTLYGFPQEINRFNIFEYAYNNPIMFVDPTGYSTWYYLDEVYRYRIDDGPNSKHIHIQGPDGKEWKQKFTGEPYEPYHKNTNDGDPPNWIRRLLKKDKDDNDNNKHGGGGTGGPGWDWDANKKSWEEENNSAKAIAEGAAVVAGGAAIVGAGYVVYRIVRFIPSLFPPLWWTLPANALVP